MATMPDWKLIEDDCEKYQAYLCSREWSVLKKAVHKRSGGKCERCRVFPGDVVHHLTYKRKYQEECGDLQHHCKWCHKFTHGEIDWDPAGSWIVSAYLYAVSQRGVDPYPPDLLARVVEEHEILRDIANTIRSLLRLSEIFGKTEGCEQKLWEMALELGDMLLPFDCTLVVALEIENESLSHYKWGIECLGLSVLSGDNLRPFTKEGKQWLAIGSR